MTRNDYQKTYYREFELSIGSLCVNRNATGQYRLGLYVEDGDDDLLIASSYGIYWLSRRKAFASLRRDLAQS